MEESNYRILVVDDDFILNELFCSFLESKGFYTASASGIQEAEKILQTDPNIDLILLDYQLDDGVGMELLDSERKAKFVATPPVIMISANENPEFLEGCFDGGVADYIIKPVNLSLLALKVRALLNSVKLQRLISLQNNELAAFKIHSEREEAIAKFTYEYLLRQNSQKIDGVDVFLQSCSSFSGDIVLSKISPSGDLYFMLADATGHGLSAAITIMPVVSVFNTMVTKGFHLQQLAVELNKKLVNDTPSDRFVAAILIEINRVKNTLSIWNGGMPAAYWIDGGAIKHRFGSSNMALGILDEDEFDANVETIPLPESGRIFAYSDGLIEQENSHEIAFGRDRLERLIVQDVDDLGEIIVKDLINHAEVEVFSDDVSICVLTPSKISSYIQKNNEDDSLVNIEVNDFKWSIKLYGKGLVESDLAFLCNRFLQQIGLDQTRCQKVFSIIGEMITNGLDHGILKLSSSLKEQEDGFNIYFSERERRIQGLKKSDSIEIELNWFETEKGRRLSIRCIDSGEGYTENSSSDDAECSGRGLKLIRLLSESCELKSPGNEILAIL